MDKIILRILILLFIIIPNIFFGQIPNHIFNKITNEEFDKKDFSISKTKIESNFGVYHFGESESEWDLIFIPFGDSIIIQIWSSIMNESVSQKNHPFIEKCQTFNKVSLDKNKFYFGNYVGQFLTYNLENEKVKSIILFGNPIEGRNYIKDSAEVGFYSYPINTFFDDKERYELSLEIKSQKYFINKTKKELRILRNTVFANYGMIFKKGSEIETYFLKKRWYFPFCKNVSENITEIERRNLETLKRIEQR